MDSWFSKGCPVCRRRWEVGDPPPLVATSIARHAMLHRCDVCGTLWEQNERFPDVIDPADARRWYPDFDEAMVAP